MYGSGAIAYGQGAEVGGEWVGAETTPELVAEYAGMNGKIGGLGLRLVDMEGRPVDTKGVVIINETPALWSAEEAPLARAIGLGSVICVSATLAW